MATADTTTLSGLLQNIYIPGIRKWINQNRPLRRRIESILDRQKFRGAKFVFASCDGHGQGIGSPGEGVALPAGGTESLVNMELTMQRHYAVIRLSGQLMATAGAADGSFEDAFDLHVKGAKDELEHDLAWNSTYGTGDGDLGDVSTYSGTTLTAKSQPTTVGAMGTRYLRKNMVVDSFSALTGGTQGANAVTLGAVTGSSNTVTVPASAGFVANDKIFRHNSRGNTTMGLGGIVDDGTRKATFQTLLRSANPMLKANILANSGTLRGWTPELQDQVCSEGWNNGNGEWPTAIYSVLQIQQRAMAYIRNDRRYTAMPEVDVDSGYKAFVWTTPNGQMPWIVDQFCRTNEVMTVNEKDLFFAILTDVEWINEDGANLRITDRVDAFEGWLRTYQNMGAYVCNSSSALKDVSHTI